MAIGISISNTLSIDRQDSGSGGGGAEEFIMRVKTDVSDPSSGKSNDDQFNINVQVAGGYVFDYDVDWGDGNTDTNVAGSILHTYAVPGEYEVKISGLFPNIYFFNRFDRLKVLELKNWGNIQWETMLNAFQGCSNMELTATDAGDFTQVNNFKSAFQNCSSITSITGSSNWINSNCTNVLLAFFGCSNMTSIETTNWDHSGCTSLEGFFQNCSSLTSIDGTNWDLSNITNFSNAFSNTTSLTTIIGNGNWRFSTTDIVNFSAFFNNCFALDGLNTTNWNMERVVSLSQAFRDCTSLTYLDVSNWDLSICVSLFLWIYNTPLLASINGIGDLDVSSVTNFGYVFSQADSLVADVTNWDVSSGTSFTNFMEGSNGSGSITGYKNWNTSSVSATCQSIFANSTNGDDDLPLWDITNSNSLNNAFRGMTPPSSTQVFNMTTSNLASANSCFGLFYQSSPINDLTIGPNVDFSNVTDFSYAFANMINLSLTFPTGFDWSSGTTFLNFLRGTNLSSADYNAILIDIENSNSNPNVSFDAQNCVATGAGLTARTALINDHGWTFNDSTP